MKKILNLGIATRIKTNLDNKNGIYSIDKDNILIEEHNSIITGNPRSIDIQEIEDKKELKSDLLMILYEAIQEANLKKLKKEKHTNTFYIKKLSQLEKEKFHLSKIDTTEGRTDIETKSGKEVVVKKTSFIKFKDILERTERINKDIQEIKDKIEKFNKEHNISIEITPEMNNFLKSIEN